MVQTRSSLLILALSCLVFNAAAQWTTGAAFSSSQQFSAAVAFDTDNAIFVNGSLDPFSYNSEGQIVVTTSGNQGQGFVIYYPSGMVLEDVDGWAGATSNYSDSYYWAAGSQRTITNQVRRSVVVRNYPGYLPTPFMEVYTGLNRYYRCVDFLDELTGFCGGATMSGDGLIDRSMDGGLTWAQTDTFPGQIISRIRFVNDQVGFAVSNGSHWQVNSTVELPDTGRVYRTTDGGDTWMSVLSNDQHGFSGVWFTDVLNGCVTRNDGVIQRTDDGGDSWLPTTVALAPPFLLTAVTGTPNGTLYASGYRVDNSGAIILASTDGGQNWSLNHYSSTGVGRRINNIYFYDDQVGYAPAWTCVWRTGNGGNINTQVPDAVATQHGLLYPSPASDQVTVDLAEFASTIRVVDIVGRTVAFHTGQMATRHTLAIAALPSGAYRVLIEAPNGRISLPLWKE